MSDEQNDFALFGHLLCHMINTVTDGHAGYKNMIQRTLSDESVRDVLTQQYRHKAKLIGEDWSLTLKEDETRGETATIYLNINLWDDEAKKNFGPDFAGRVLIREIDHCLTGETEYVIHAPGIPQSIRESLIGEQPTKIIDHHSLHILAEAGVTIKSIEDWDAAVTIKLTSIITPGEPS